MGCHSLLYGRCTNYELICKSFTKLYLLTGLCHNFLSPRFFVNKTPRTVSRHFRPFFWLKRFNLPPYEQAQMVFQNVSFLRRYQIAKLKNYVSAQSLTKRTHNFSLYMVVFIFSIYCYWMGKRTQISFFASLFL